MILLWLSIFLQLLDLTTSYKMFQDEIPNGGRVPHPCLPNHIWKGVGHKNSHGGGQRNPFGLDFANNGHVWDAGLCRKDSDGDGLTNGQELGDPECEWTPGKAPSLLHGLSHPGVCEPLNSAKCASVNTWDFCTKEDFNCSAIDSPDVKNITMRIPTTSVPSMETNYYCQVFDIPHDMDYHIVASRPILDNENVIHHMIIFACHDHTLAGLSEFRKPVPCGMQAVGMCGGIMSTWTVGQVGRCHANPHAGVRFGASGVRKIMLQIHWNNPLRKSGYEDGSGMILYYTPKLKTYDMAPLLIGNMGLRIPAHREKFSEKAGCSASCTSKALTSPIYIVDGFLHMHYQGIAIELNQYRNGQLVRMIASEPDFSYDRPLRHVFTPVVEVLPGDELNITCNFKSVGIPHATYFGNSTQDEMCFAFVSYYPPSPLQFCAAIGPGFELCTSHFNITGEVREINGCMIGEATPTTYPEQYQAFGELIRACDATGVSCYEACYELLTVDPHPCMAGAAKKFLELNSGFTNLLRSCDSQMYDGEPLVRSGGVGICLNLHTVALLILTLVKMIS